MRPVTVIGGGFSGLATAYYLMRRGVPVRVLEKDDRLGGLISTADTPHGPAETAANGILNSRRVEDLFADINLELCFPKPTAKARYIYRDKPRRWPLSPGESLSTVGRLTGTLIKERGLGAKPQESLDAWGKRVLGEAATNYVLAPAVQGIYGTTPEHLSAKLILPRKAKDDKPRKRGIVAPPRGMGDLVDRLREVLEAGGVEFHLNETATLDMDGPVVVATSAYDAAALLETAAPRAAELLASVERVSIVKVTVFVEESGPTGFGLLFPKSEGFHALGVLFNTDIFDNRGTLRSETWMIEGDSPRGVPWVEAPEQDIVDQIVKERARFAGREVVPEGFHIKRWPQALPRYSTALESVLDRDFDLPGHVHLVGNYLGGIGLAKILRRADAVAQELAGSPGETP